MGFLLFVLWKYATGVTGQEQDKIDRFLENHTLYRSVVLFFEGDGPYWQFCRFDECEVCCRCRAELAELAA